MPKSPEGEYKPSPEEIQKAEEMMTSEQIKMTENREAMLEKLSVHLDELHYDTFERNNVEEQSQERFGKSWDDVRSEMKKKIEEGLTLVSVAPELEGQPQTYNRDHGGVYRSSAIKGDALIPGILDRTGNWMTRRYLEVLYLSYPHPKFLKNEQTLREVEKIIETSGYASRSLADKDVLRHRITVEELRVAQDLFPEKVEAVLKSHGLEEQDKGEYQ